MHSDTLAFIRSNSICVFAVEMPDGSPHGATVHYAHQEEPFLFMFETSARYKKSQPLLGGNPCRATVVIGFEEGPGQATFQADGEARLITDPALKEAYLSKFPHKREKALDPDNIFFSFTPSWWRFTSWSASEGKKVLTSDGSTTVAGIPAQ